LLRLFITSILRLVELVTIPEGISVDGFRLRHTWNGFTGHGVPLYDSDIPLELRENLNGIRVTEPRIELIAKQLAALLQVLEFTCNGKVVRVVGFRLRSLGDWLVKSSNDPAQLLPFLSWHCKLSCSFCYEKGNPPRWARTQATITTSEIETRISHYNIEKGTMLFRQTFVAGEVLTRPGIIKYLSRIRALNPHSLLPIVTNGAALTEQFVKKLAALSPILLVVSINTVDPKLRRHVMGDRKPGIAIQSLPLLKQYKVSHIVSIVASKVIPPSDIQKTIHYADKHDPIYIKVMLPGVTKYHPKESVDATAANWSKIVRAIREVRLQVDTPVVVQPALFEDELFGTVRPEGVLVQGTVKHSPARLAGLPNGCLIRAVEGVPVESPAQLGAVLHLFANTGNTSDAELSAHNIQSDKIKDSDKTFVDLEIVEGLTSKQIRIFSAEENDCQFPYIPRTVPLFGILASFNGINRSAVESIADIMHRHGARDGLFMTSRFQKQHLDQALKCHSGLLDGKRLSVAVPSNDFFGGNIMIGDLMVVDDFVACGRRWIKSKGRRPDVIIIPSTPFLANDSGWKRDISGCCYLDIERRLHTPVELLSCESIRM
jgi:sulfatase maturation enzyme AslB (radical SAM superfamily)